MGGGMRSAPFGVLTRPKRWVRAAHGRVCVAKTHKFLHKEIRRFVDFFKTINSFEKD
jgi:hypothetical protein